MASIVISPDNIAAIVGLQAERLDNPCKEILFLSISDFVHPWRLVFSELLSSVDLSDIDAENQGVSEKQKRVACLRKWKSKCGAEATYRVIVQSVLNCGGVDLAEAICRQLLRHEGW